MGKIGKAAQGSASLFLATLVIVCSGIGISSAAQAEIQRNIFQDGTHYLKSEVLEDGLYHFEFGSGQPPALKTPIATSPQVVKDSYSGNIGTTSSVSIDNKSLCITLNDLTQKDVLTTFCPQMGNGLLKLDFKRGLMEHVYGLGEKFRTPGEPNGDWAGQTRKPGIEIGNMMTAFDQNYTADIEMPIMYAVGPHGLNYALFVDHVRAQTWNFETDPWTMTTSGDTLRFYLIAGKGLPSLRQRFMEIVGRPPIPPKKAFGLWVSEYGYQTWGEMDDRLTILRAKNFPVDGFVVDAKWFGVQEKSPNTQMGSLAFDPVKFPDPATHISQYNKDGVGLILIEEPYVGRNLKAFSELENKNYLVKSVSTGQSAIFSDWFGETGMIDFTNPDGASFWHKTKRQPLIDMGIFGHWTDLGEPSEPQGGGIYHGVAGIKGNGSEDMHNLYNFKWLESIADGYAQAGLTQRPFMFSRSGTTGLQRFGSALWSGDISGKLSSLAAHLNSQMHISLSGIDYYGADIGGYDRHKHDADLGEVYSRWFAHGTSFDVPVRPHTAKFDDTYKTSPAEMGWIESNLYNLRKRYELIPYYYSLAYKAWQSGEPVFPPLVYYYQDDPNVRKMGSEKLIGRDMLVATGANTNWSVDVYLPEGEWVDYYDHVHYDAPSGGRVLPTYPFVRDQVFRLPTFVRGGTILPKALVDDKTFNALGQRGDNVTHDELRLQVFSSARKSSFTVYEDDGVSIKYKVGSYSQTPISQQQKAGVENITINPLKGTYNASANRNNILEIVLHPGEDSKSVMLNGVKLAELTEDKLSRESEGWTKLSGNRVAIKTGVLSVQKAKIIAIQL